VVSSAIARRCAIFARHSSRRVMRAPGLLAAIIGNCAPERSVKALTLERATVSPPTVACCGAPRPETALSTSEHRRQ